MRTRFRLLLLVVGLLVLGSSGSSQLPASAASTTSSGYAVRAVLASRQGNEFQYFPHRVGTARCTIPFGMTRGVKARCSSRAFVRDPNSGQVFVNFSEHWAWRAFHYSGTPRRRLHHRWVFDLLPSGKVVFVRQAGDFPPNFSY
jgi:hypothetical protein